jgi:hypothetical protein
MLQFSENRRKKEDMRKKVDA